MTIRPAAGTVRRIWCGFAVVALAIWGCAYSLVNGGVVNESRADRIEAQIQQIRELDFIAKVPVVVKTPAEARQLMAEEVARDHSNEQLRIGGRSGAMTGLYPPGINLRDEALKFLSSQIVGFYEPHEKEMVLVKGSFSEQLLNSFGYLNDRQEEMIFAHELTHALQDQHFKVEPMIDKVKDNDDRSLALKAVLEGDATIAGAGYIAGRLDKATITLVVSSLADLPKKSAEKTPGVPLGILAPLFFQYSDGSRFVSEAWRRGGWAAVNAIYRHPPQSTQQIMQPELYFDHPSPPDQIDIAGYGGVMHGWKKVDDDTYGELLLRVILERNLAPHAPALKTLPRWAGDRIITLQKGDALTLIWIIAFRDDTAAEQFGEAYESILNRMRGERNAHQVQVKSSAVMIVIGPGAEDFARLGPAVWKASTIRRIEAPAPSTLRVSINPHPMAAAQ